MAKTIRFNLQFGNHERPIRNVDELRENFNVDLIAESFQNGLLQRWLEAQNEKELLSKINEIPPVIENNFEDIERLCKIFMPKLSREEIEGAAYAFEFRKREEKRLIAYNEAAYNKEIVIEDYYKGYACLLVQIIENSENYQFLKASVAEICNTYKYLLTLNVADFYNYMVFDYPLVILSLLGNKDMRDLLTSRIGLEKIYGDITDPGNQQKSFIYRWKNNKPLPHLLKCNTKEEMKKITDSEVFYLGKAVQGNYKISDLTPPFEYIPIKYLSYPDHIENCQKTTHDYWSDNLIPEGKKCLVIKFDNGTPPNFINDKPKDDCMLSPADVEKKFPVLDKLYYKSKNDKTELIYMEI